jgi:hypothetical protein
LFTLFEKDERKKLRFMKEVFSLIAKSRERDTSPYLSAEIMRLLKSELNLGDIYFDIKNKYNKLLLSMEEDILKHIYNSEDKMLMALKYAMIGNFIDFGAMDKVDISQLERLIENAPNQTIDMKKYKEFINQLKSAKRLAYLADNAGEIVLDKIFIKIMKELYTAIDINVIVRGKPIYNDATIADAEEIGLCDLVNVIGNGTDIPGTQLNELNTESKEIINNADLIIAKGQGNFETLFPCDKNIYYIFLCKCDLFLRRFNIEKFKGVFANEKDIKVMMK